MSLDPHPLLCSPGRRDLPLEARGGRVGHAAVGGVDGQALAGAAHLQVAAQVGRRGQERGLHQAVKGVEGEEEGRGGQGAQRQPPAPEAEEGEEKGETEQVEFRERGGVETVSREGSGRASCWKSQRWGKGESEVSSVFFLI